MSETHSKMFDVKGFFLNTRPSIEGLRDEPIDNPSKQWEQDIHIVVESGYWGSSKRYKDKELIKEMKDNPDIYGWRPVEWETGWILESIKPVEKYRISVNKTRFNVPMSFEWNNQFNDNRPSEFTLIAHEMRTNKPALQCNFKPENKYGKYEVLCGDIRLKPPK